MNFCRKGKRTSQILRQVVMFEFRDPSGPEKVNSNINVGVLEFKLHEVHFGDMFSEANLVRLRRPCLQSEPKL